MDKLTDTEFEAADRIEAVLETTGPEGATPSAIGRRAHTDRTVTLKVLGWMVGQQFAHTTGNGNWARYHAGRA